jgi:four helix bundle protein
MRRAAVSVPSNIAEGKGRYSKKELIQFLYKARGSLLELETQIIIAGDLDYLDQGATRTLSTRTLEVNRILNGLINHFLQELQT